MPRKTTRNNEEKDIGQTKLPVKVEDKEKKTFAAERLRKGLFKHRHHTGSSVGQILVDVAYKLIKKSLFLLVFWITFSLGLLMTGSYLIFKEFFIGMAYPFWYLALVALLFFGVYGIAGFLYGVAMALLHSLLSVSSNLGDIIQKTVLRVKNSIESKVDRFADELEQNSLLELIKKTFEDISKDIRRYAAKTALGILVIGLLGGVLFFVKNIVVRSFKQVQNKAEFFTKMSIRFSLLIAVILNLKFFTKIALVFGYMLGVFLVLSQVIIWYILQ